MTHPHSGAPTPPHHLGEHLADIPPVTPIAEGNPSRVTRRQHIGALMLARVAPTVELVPTDEYLDGTYRRMADTSPKTLLPYDSEGGISIPVRPSERPGDAGRSQVDGRAIAVERLLGRREIIERSNLSSGGVITEQLVKGNLNVVRGANPAEDPIGTLGERFLQNRLERKRAQIAHAATEIRRLENLYGTELGTGEAAEAHLDRIHATRPQKRSVRLAAAEIERMKHHRAELLEQIKDVRDGKSVAGRIIAKRKRSISHRLGRGHGTGH